MAIDCEKPAEDGEQNLEHLLLAADFVDEYPTLSSLVPGDTAGTRGDMVNRVAGLYGEIELHLNDAAAGEGEVSWVNFYLSKSPQASEEHKNGWLTVAVAGTKMPDGSIDYRRTFAHRSRWELMMRQVVG